MTIEQLRREVAREVSAAIAVGEAKGAPAISYALESRRVRAAFDAYDKARDAAKDAELRENEASWRDLSAILAGTRAERDAALSRAEQAEAALAEAKTELRRLMDSIWKAEYRDQAPEWSPLDDLPGMISQMDNMYAGVRDQRDEERKAHQAFRDGVRDDLMAYFKGSWPTVRMGFLGKYDPPAEPAVDPLFLAMKEALGPGFANCDETFAANLRTAIERAGGVKAVFGEEL